MSPIFLSAMFSEKQVEQKCNQKKRSSDFSPPFLNHDMVYRAANHAPVVLLLVDKRLSRSSVAGFMESGTFIHIAVFIHLTMLLKMNGVAVQKNSKCEQCSLSM